MTLLAPLLLLLAGAPVAPAPPEVERWIAAARAHQPGEIDEALLEVAGWRAPQFETIRKQLWNVLRESVVGEEDRNDVLRRGALLHTDIALLTPGRAATFTRFSQPPSAPVPSHGRADPGGGTAIVGRDGQFRQSAALTAHWDLARALIERIRPRPADDPFVAAWYRAVGAAFLGRDHLAQAYLHLAHARAVLPQDPWVLFYTGAMHEAFASPRFQNIKRTYRGQESVLIGGRGAELDEAAHAFRRAIAADPGLAEAHLRLGRVLHLQGRHADALAALQRALAASDESRLRYYADLFSGSVLARLGRGADAREAFERAAAREPEAQAPLLGLSALARRSGDRQEALVALDRLSRLPADADERIEPWWSYYHSYAANADSLLEELRRRFRHEDGR